MLGEWHGPILPPFLPDKYRTNTGHSGIESGIVRNSAVIRKPIALHDLQPESGIESGIADRTNTGHSLCPLKFQNFRPAFLPRPHAWRRIAGHVPRSETPNTAAGQSRTAARRRGQGHAA